MSDRLAWLEQWCPECHAAPGARCTRWRSGRGAAAGRSWSHISTSLAAGSSVRVRRARQGRRALRDADRPGGFARPRGATAAGAVRAGRGGRRSGRSWSAGVRPSPIVPFSGRAGVGRRTDTITLLRPEGEELVEVERWTGSRRALSRARGARLGSLRHLRRASAGRGEVIWSAEDRCVVIRGTRGERPFEEFAA